MKILTAIGIIFGIITLGILITPWIFCLVDKYLDYVFEKFEK